jgi:hypothetical protein
MLCPLPILGIQLPCTRTALPMPTEWQRTRGTTTRMVPGAVEPSSSRTKRCRPLRCTLRTQPWNGRGISRGRREKGTGRKQSELEERDKQLDDRRRVTYTDCDILHAFRRTKKVRDSNSGRIESGDQPPHHHHHLIRGISGNIEIYIVAEEIVSRANTLQIAFI